MHTIAEILNTPMKLRLDGMQSNMTLLTGNIHVIAEEDERLADSLLWGTLIDMCNAGGSACLVSATRTARSLKQSGMCAQVREAMENRRLTVLETGDNARRIDSSMLQHQLMKELRHWHAEHTGLLVIDGAEQLFPHPDGAMLTEWREWAERHGNAVLLLFRQSSVNGNDVMSDLAPHGHICSGMARIKSKYGAATWEVFHWFCGSELIAGKSFPLCLNAQHRPEVLREEDANAPGVELAADETHVLAQRSVFLQKESAPSDWELVDGDTESMLARASNAVASTVVLAFSSTTDFQRLVRSVFEMRKQCGARLKIVIREVNSRLRYGQETLAVRLGANLVVPAEISYARFLSLTSMVQGQSFPQPLPATFEQAMADAMPEAEQGYLPPHAFSQAVNATLERSRILHVQNVLLRLPLAYGLLPLDALRYCNIKRAGDLCTADRDSVYLFLYACRESDTDKALERLFGLPVDELFSSEDRVMSAHGIRDLVADLEARHRSENFPDLTDVLAAAVSPRTADRAAEPTATEKKGPAVLRYTPPSPAIRRPLLVKGSPTLTEVAALTS